MNEDLFSYWSFARQNLRFTDADFWRLTPREFHALAEVWNRGEETEDRRTATVCMVLANINRDSDKKPDPFTVGDFMPRRADEPAREQSWEAQKAIFGAIAAANKPTA